MFIPDPDFFPIPDPGVKKALDPGSGSATLARINIYFCRGDRYLEHVNNLGFFPGEKFGDGFKQM